MVDRGSRALNGVEDTPMISHEIIQFHPSDEESGESYDLRVEVRAVRHCGGNPCIARGGEGVTIFHQDTFPIGLFRNAPERGDISSILTAPFA